MKISILIKLILLTTLFLTVTEACNKKDKAPTHGHTMVTYRTTTTTYRPGTGDKPGNCYRPGRKRRMVDDQLIHKIEKRQTQGGNGWMPPPTPGPGFGGGGARPECYRDYDCIANKKCCSGYCQTPSFSG